MARRRTRATGAACGTSTCLPRLATLRGRPCAAAARCALWDTLDAGGGDGGNSGASGEGGDHDGIDDASEKGVERMGAVSAEEVRALLERVLSR